MSTGNPSTSTILSTRLGILLGDPILSDGVTDANLFDGRDHLHLRISFSAAREVKQFSGMSVHFGKAITIS